MDRAGPSLAQAKNTADFIRQQGVSCVVCLLGNRTVKIEDHTCVRLSCPCDLCTGQNLKHRQESDLVVF
ncbi:hypothetical protein, partial [Parendozoicomonas sp. Alg238-R29]|uniref:hypothetical protein n=1 Tax=Parendozoicomonas sp. Alg238-R29 TaxID=2993446 RepID=UPI00248DC24C